ncbi:MAG: penicillin-binding protein 2 [Myxococcales bacterium]|nr:penicillin-binding protein 2 [Myxococcales bacterium]
MQQPTHGEIPEFRRRYRYLVAFVLLSFVVLMGRLWHLQIARGDHYRRLTENNIVQSRRIPTVRGRIYDRRGRLLVANRPSYDVYVSPRFVTRDAVEKLVELLSLSPDRARSLRKRVERYRGKRRVSEMLLLRDVSRDQLARLVTHKGKLHGINVLAVAHRHYREANLAAHVLGYMNEVTRAQLRRDKGRHYHPGDLVGRAGLERAYERHLRGVPGRERIVVDAHGHRKGDAVAAELLKGERRSEPIPGHNIYLTLDVELQRLAERAMRRHASGAAVVVEVNTGRLLAYVSRPAFDPNTMTGRLSVEEARRLLEDPHRPLLDKVSRENYFPGSIYKVVSAIASLEENILDPEEKVKCVRFHHFGGRNFRCGHAHGKVALHHAIAESCNVYFYTLAEMVGMDRMARFARMLGLGASTGLGLNGEVGGLVPTKEWYKRRKRPFRIGFTLNAAIGQGDVKVTPLQMVMLYAAIANGGKLLSPQLVERIETSDGMLVQGFAPRLRRQIKLKPETLRRVREALAAVVAHRDGTAHKARLDNIEVAGKTGTAQVGRRRDKDGKLTYKPPHAWFAAYAPARAPRIAVVVFVKNGGKAARVAAPVAMQIINGYFKYVSSGSTSGGSSSGGAGSTSKPVGAAAKRSVAKEPAR